MNLTHQYYCPITDQYRLKLLSLDVRIALLLLSLTYLSIGKSFASELNVTNSHEETATEMAEERWFEIEIILYKSTSDRGFINESWDPEITYELPESLNDFLNPTALIASELLEQDTSPNKVAGATLLSKKEDIQANRLAQDSTSLNHTKSSEQSAIDGLSTEQQETSPESTSDNTLDIENENVTDRETPFLKLDSSLLQLNKEAKSISVHPSYRLLAHFSWRQPVDGKNLAEPVRIAGGFDYQGLFEYSGEGKLKLEELATTNGVTPLNDSNSSNSYNDGNSLNEAVVESTGRTNQLAGNKIQSRSLNEATEDDFAESHTTLQPNYVALPWVPEVDGSAKVYIHRNYLHMDASLYFRKPGKEEIDMLKLPYQSSLFGDKISGIDSLLGTPTIISKEQLPPNSSGRFNTESNTSDPLILDETSAFEAERNTILISQDDLSESAEEGFVWHYDDNFLSQDTEKSFTERLFNYPLSQTRRMRSTELHYFDHPLIGMLVMIRPYEPNSKVDLLKDKGEVDATH
ncbi:MAG: peptidoglycan binding protein CsiV [Kangiellaceae bacterium]|nr:peptidoglycan binding protein CsiV [Kangiellaceae bacterium]